MTARLSRREILAGAAITGVAAAGGALLGRQGSTPAAGSPTPRPSHTSRTSSAPSSSPSPSGDATTNPASPVPPTNNAAVRAYEAESMLIATYAAAVTGLDHVAVTRLDAVLVDHRRHLDALAAAATAAVPGWTPSGLPRLAAPQSSGSPMDVAALERAASAALLALVPSAIGDLAGLIASIAASESAHAQVVGVLRHLGAP